VVFVGPSTISLLDSVGEAHGCQNPSGPSVNLLRDVTHKKFSLFSKYFIAPYLVYGKFGN
jgi:hypothetical protein